MSNYVGDPLPENLRARVLDPEHRVELKRKCVSCGGVWPTVEIVVGHKDWTGKADFCYIHGKSHVLASATIEEGIRSGKTVWAGRALAMSFGGVYRRRECRDICCEREPREGKRFRWTTVEVSPFGTIVEDIAKCPRCGADGKLVRPKKGKRAKPRPRRSSF